MNSPLQFETGQYHRSIRGEECYCVIGACLNAFSLDAQVFQGYFRTGDKTIDDYQGIQHMRTHVWASINAKRDLELLAQRMGVTLSKLEAFQRLNDSEQWVKLDAQLTKLGIKEKLRPWSKIEEVPFTKET